MFRPLSIVFSLSLAVFGCSSSPNGVVAGDDAGVGGGGDDTADLAVSPDLMLPDRDPTDHPPLLQMDPNTGTVLKAIEVWTIVWQGDEELGARTNRFADWMVQSDYWKTSLSEYGVGPGKAMGVLVIPSAPPATLDDSAVGPLVRAAIANGSFPMPNVNTAFSFIVPTKTKSTLQGSAGCQAYGGYHAETRIKTGVNQYVPYLINLQCGGFGGVTAFDSLTEVVSHETSEAATDPHPYFQPGWVQNVGTPLGGEISDLCAGLSMTYPVNVTAPEDGGISDSRYYVTRNWSNKAAAAGNIDPCQPTPPNRPYFNVAVNPTDIDVTPDTSNPDGTDVDAVFEPYAFGDVGVIKWQLEGPPGPGITVTPSKGSGMAGQSIPFKIHIASTVRGNGQSFPIYLATSSAKGGSNQWVSSITIE